jgi:hypothetical protein
VSGNLTQCDGVPKWASDQHRADMTTRLGSNSQSGTLMKPDLFHDAGSIFPIATIWQIRHPASNPVACMRTNLTKLV